MAEYISRRAAIKAIEKYEDERGVFAGTVKTLILELPITDAEIIIRCKACKHFDGQYCRFHLYPHKTTGNGFCNHAEQK